MRYHCTDMSYTGQGALDCSSLPYRCCSPGFLSPTIGHAGESTHHTRKILKLTICLQTFPTSVATYNPSRITVDPALLATSNGRRGGQQPLLGSTSEGSVPSAALRRLQTNAAALAATALGISLSFFLFRFPVWI